ncbi:hypothetical protein BDQ17DRAFT_1379057 [Cyathus striatus]|nr:hypothetical protein BDQ17DRAFT_1379057 [Cyathus striatus]
MMLMAFMNLRQTFFSAVFVTLGISDPADWPALFGIWSQTKSVRTFWGKSWHQCLRRVRYSCHFSPHTLFISSTFISPSNHRQNT